MATLDISHMSFVQVSTCRHHGGKYDDLSATSLQNCDTTLNSEFIPCLGVLDSSNRSSAKNKAVRIVPPNSTPNFVLSSATPNEAMNK